MSRPIELPQERQHNELFNKIDRRRVPRDVYTFGDLWSYFIVRTIGHKFASTLSKNSSTLEDRQRMREIATYETREPSEDEMARMESLVGKNGIDLVLFAIDSLALSEWEEGAESEGLPDFRKVGSFLKEAKGFMLRTRFF